MGALLTITNYLLFVYYLVSNLVYLVLLLAAWVDGTRHRWRLASLRLEKVDESPFTPPITLIVPAHDEELTIVDSINALLAIDYPELEVIVVNDGSADQTLPALQQAFQLYPARILYLPRIPSAKVHRLFASARDPRLVVVDKECGRNKADASNAGLNAATSPYVCVLDADSILEKDALLRIMAQVVSNYEEVVAVGGIVRVLNGSVVAQGAIREVRLGRKPLEILQTIEYLRSFLIGRQGWAAFNILPIISGAFGIFRRDTLVRVGGFRKSAIGEDMDLVVRMHREMLGSGRPYRIPHVAEPICWTQVPDDYKSLAQQRARWHKGLLDVLWNSRDMLFRPRYGWFGCLMLPYLWLFELLAPVVELVGYLSIGIAALIGVLSAGFFLRFLLFGYAFSTFISVGAVVQEELTFRRYNRLGDLARLICFCFLEHFPYRQLNLLWRLAGFWQYARGDLQWKAIKRKAFDGSDAAAAPRPFLASPPPAAAQRRTR